MVVNKKTEPGQTTCEGLIQCCARQRKSVHKPAFNGGLWQYKSGYSALGQISATPLRIPARK